MFDIPDLDKIRAYTTYTDLFMLTLVWNIAVYSLFAFGFFIIFFAIKIYLMKKVIKNQQGRQSLLTEQPDSRQAEGKRQTLVSSTIISNPNQIPTNDTNKKCNISLLDVVSFLTSITFYITLMGVAGIYLGFYSFGKIGRGIGFDILAVIVMSSIVILPTLIWKKLTKTKPKRITNLELLPRIIGMALWVILCIALVIMLKGVCVCVFNDKYGTVVNKDFDFSTQFMRKYQIDKICPQGKIGHIFATLAQNGSDSVFINVHTGTDIQGITIIMETLTTPSTKFNITSSEPYKLIDVEYIGKRNIFSIYFQGLKPDTIYSLIVKQTNNDLILYRSTYRTLPDQNAKQIRFVSGGDIGIEKQASILISHLTQFDPHVILIGGDNAYDDGMNTCFNSWDDMYDLLDELNSRLNRLVPIVLSIGNHDVGYDALAGIKIDFMDYYNLPYYFLFNPQHSSLTAHKIPQPKERLSYHYHILGPTVHVHLDSGYVAQYSQQRSFIQKVSRDFPKLYRFANYHNPIYPSCTDNKDGSNDRLVIEQALNNWIPLFDQYEFTAVFEHHTHHRKFTKKLKDNKPQADTNKGTRYIGDGSWGVPEDPCPTNHVTPYPQNFQYFQKQHPNHVWLVKLYKDQSQNYSIQYKAININNTVVFNKTEQL